MSKNGGFLERLERVERIERIELSRSIAHLLLHFLILLNVKTIITISTYEFAERMEKRW